MEKGKECFGFAYLFERFIPLLKEVGVSDAAINTILVENPAEILAFDAPRKFNPKAVHPRVLALKKQLKIE
ncbi:hypothetical protein FA937_02835 [Mycoplasmoides pneumoniae]|nr:hypothetical protein FA925_02835 [Mycoplasmoides pneumoniae]QHR10344.1 hypothetical protein FA928_02835 [Mycoplasmoides pneumoniae]QHR13142.1 hypothetical protein FA932_02835 [Mycoplasmoides pneumoniae]QHR14537.1 hypothetical protein FA934_02835 [Mycoplasmoides pneumoniae]QHR16636.1 hypothetical protein FA937_02835 [Mycoplasmoides pneumoniae]